MLYYIGKELTYMPKKQSKNIEMMVDPDGKVIAYNKIINGDRIGLGNEEAEEIVNHARELEQIVSERSELSKK